MTTSANRAAAILAVLLGASLAACTSAPTQQAPEEAIDDGVVTAKIKAALVEDPLTKAHQIAVETFKGTVQLSGFVESDEARERALKLARGVDGVRKVKDAMEVRDDSTT